MADAALGSISLGIEVLKIVHSYCSKFRGAREEVEGLLAESKHLDALLSRLSSPAAAAAAAAANGNRPGGLWTREELESLEKVGEECRKAREEIEMLLAPFADLAAGEGGGGGIQSGKKKKKKIDLDVLKQKMTFPLKADKVKDLTTRLRAWKSAMVLEMESLQMSASIGITGKVDDVRDGLVRQDSNISEFRGEFQQTALLLDQRSQDQRTLLRRIDDNVAQTLDSQLALLKVIAPNGRLVISNDTTLAKKPGGNPDGNLSGRKTRSERVYYVVNFLSGAIEVMYYEEHTHSNSFKMTTSGYSVSFLAKWLPRVIQAKFSVAPRLNMGIETDLVVDGNISNKNGAARMCRDGDISGLKRLFQQGKASPKDILRYDDPTMTSEGYYCETLFHIAIENRRYEICTLLYDLGADPYKKVYHLPDNGDDAFYASPVELLNPFHNWDRIHQVFDWEDPDIQDAFMGAERIGDFIWEIFYRHPDLTSLELIQATKIYLDKIGWNQEFIVQCHPKQFIIWLYQYYHYYGDILDDTTLDEILRLCHETAGGAERVWGSKHDFLNLLFHYPESHVGASEQHPTDLRFLERYVFKPEIPGSPDSYTSFKLPVSRFTRLLRGTSYPLFDRFCEQLDVKAVDSNGYTPLIALFMDRACGLAGIWHPAVCPPQADFIRRINRLAELGSDFNHVDREGRTVLHHAVIMNYAPVVLECLLQHGADPEIPDKSGKTPLMLSSSMAKADSKSPLLELCGSPLEDQLKFGQVDDIGDESQDIPKPISDKVDTVSGHEKVVGSQDRILEGKKYLQIDPVWLVSFMILLLVMNFVMWWIVTR